MEAWSEEQGGSQEAWHQSWPCCMCPRAGPMPLLSPRSSWFPLESVLMLSSESVLMLSFCVSCSKKEVCGVKYEHSRQKQVWGEKWEHKENRLNGTKGRKGETGKLVTACPLIQTKARGQFLPLTCLCLTPSGTKKQSSRFYLLQMLSHSLHAHTGKAGLLCVTAHGPVIKTKAWVFPWGTLQEDGLHKDFLLAPNCWIILLLVYYFWKTEDDFSQKLLILNIDQMLHVKMYSF